MHRIPMVGGSQDGKTIDFEKLYETVTFPVMADQPVNYPVQVDSVMKLDAYQLVRRSDGNHYYQLEV